jgi:hypothetical protein
MAFRQHNPNVLPSRHEGGSRWKVIKSNPESVIVQRGGKVSLPLTQQATRHSWEHVLPDEASRSWERSSFLTEENNHYGNAYLHNSTKIASTAPSTLPKGLYRIPTLNRNLLRSGINDGMWSNSSDSIRLEKLNILGNNATSDPCGVNRLEASQPTKYVEAARSSTSVPSTISVTTQSLKIFNDNGMDHTHKEIKNVSSPSTTFHEYVQKLHLLSDTGDCRSAHEAEVLLLEMINNYKAGLHNFQPDGGCYNRYDALTTLVLRCAAKHKCLTFSSQLK